MAALNESSINRFKVKLVDPSSGLSVVLDVSPDISESQSVTYKNYDPVHMPGTIYAFGSSTSRVFSINNVRLVSRSADDATRNLYIVTTLRGWTKPRFGTGSSTISKQQRGRRYAISAADSKVRSQLETSFNIQKEQGRVSEGDVFGASEELGAPPAVLLLSAYADPNIGTDGRTLKGLINQVPVVITQLTLPFTSEVDYILTAQGEGKLDYIPAGIPFPTVLMVDMNLNETHSPTEYSKFSLDDYRKGKLTGF